MNLAWYLIPVLLSLTVFLAIWTALRLIFWSRMPQNIAGAVMLFAMAVNLFGYLCQLINNQLEILLFWEKIQVIGVNLIYPAWLIFILYFTGNAKRVTPSLLGVLAALSAFPILIFIIPATSAWFIQASGVIPVGPFYVINQNLGWVVYCATAIAQLEGILGAIYLGQQLGRVRPVYRRYLFILFFSQFFAYIAIWLEVSGLNPFFPISLFSLSFIPPSLAVTWAIFALRVGQTLPLMREKVVETMHDGVIILGENQNIAYLNPAARRMFQLQSEQNEKLSLPQLSPILSTHIKNQTSDDSILIGEMSYSLRQSSIEDWKGDISGQVLVLRNVTDHERMEQALQKRALELSRSNVFIQALSMVAARAAASADLKQVYNTLRDELHRLDLDFCLGMRSPDQGGYVIEYLSLDFAVLQVLEKLIGLKGIGFRLPELGEINAINGIEQDGAIFVPRIIDSLHLVFERFPKNFEETLLKASGLSLQMSSLTFRLAAQGEEFGMLAIWGPTLRLEDLSPLSTFAAQVSAAIQKVRLIHNEHQRITELEQTNRIMVSLTQVAARFEANLNQDQIMDVLGVELRKLGVSCFLAFIDPDTEELVGRYTSVAPDLYHLIEKVTGTKLEDFRISYKNWQALDPDATGPASIIKDPIEYASRISKSIPKSILKYAIQMIGITPHTPAVWLPLRASGHNIGILTIWGFTEPGHYLPGFSLFGRQVATAIEKARLMTDLEALKTFNESIVLGVAEAIVSITPEGEITFANPAAGKLVGLPPGDLAGKKWNQFIPSEEREETEAWLSAPHGANAFGVASNILHQDGHIIPVLATVQNLIQDEQIVSRLISLVDIQMRVQAEKQILASIEEKEALLKEIHHRVKNNLQIISSLLSLQASRTTDKNMVEAFRDSQNRVRSMALIHEKLYRSNNLARIRFDEYIKELSFYLLRAYSDLRISLDIQAEPLFLDIDTAIPCGLIINEVVTNSIKHAFPAPSKPGERPPNKIGIDLCRIPDQRIKLSITDNGVGFPEELDYHTTDSLGLQLVRTLTGQLDGDLAIFNHHGAHTEIFFTGKNTDLG
jgi:PAS domain S-box-containing protein